MCGGLFLTLFKAEVLDCLPDELVKVKFGFRKAEFLPVKPGYLKDPVYLSPHADILIIYYLRVFFNPVGRGIPVGVQQYLGCQGDGGYRSFKLMCHVIDKIILDLRQFFLFDDGSDDVHESEDGHQDEDGGEDQPDRCA